MKFVWITPTYRVNIESIFSLQEESKTENPDYIVWQNAYNEYLKTVQRELPPLEIDGELFDPTNESDADSSKIQKYAVELEKKINETISETIGDQPPKYICKYVIITHTGMKINVSQDKYELINNTIDELQNKKEK